MTNRFIGPLLCGGLLSLAALTPAAAKDVPPAGGVCSPTKMKYLASFQAEQRTSQNFGNIIEATVTFTQGGTGASCVVVRFSADASSPADNVVVRAYLDNTTAALPNEAFYSGPDGNSVGAHSFDFIFPSVTPGSHVVHMQFKSAGGAVVYVFRHNTIVQHAP